MVKPFLLAPRVDGTIIIIRKEKSVFRQAGKAGADLHCTIAGMEAYRLEKQFITNWEKLNRITRLRLNNVERKGVKARQTKAVKLKNEVLILAAQYASKGRDLVALIANSLTITPRRVRQILKAAKGK